MRQFTANDGMVLGAIQWALQEVPLPGTSVVTRHAARAYFRLLAEPCFTNPVARQHAFIRGLKRLVEHERIRLPQRNRIEIVLPSPENMPAPEVIVWVRQRETHHG